MVLDAPFFVPAEEMLDALSYCRGAPQFQSHHPVAGLQVGLAPGYFHFNDDVVFLAVYQARYVGEAVGPLCGLADR
jgi:hypothetical protein